MKAWPIDPLALRDLKLEVSEKLMVSFRAMALAAMASRWRSLSIGNAPKLRETPYAEGYQAAGANPVVARIATWVW